MLLEMDMPACGPAMTAGIIQRVLVTPGARVERGAGLLEVRVDLTEVAAQNCAPVFTFRMVSAEAGWVRDVAVQAGDTCPVGARLGLVSTESGEPVAPVRRRPLRVSVATIVE
jgi:pyruvate/2-oxoglutarate dehydrogenase complex dihydrolipoamide acyltransferase (E2) component